MAAKFPPLTPNALHELRKCGALRLVVDRSAQTVVIANVQSRLGTFALNDIERFLVYCKEHKFRAVTVK